MPLPRRKVARHLPSVAGLPDSVSSRPVSTDSADPDLAAVGSSATTPRMPRPNVEPLSSAKASLLVREMDLASNLSIPGAGEYPGVLATTRMIALMEIAAAQCLV